MGDRESEPSEYWFEELDVGRTHAVDSAVTVTEEDVDRFAELTGDTHPLTTDAGAETDTDTDTDADAVSRFGGPVVHENLVFALVEAVAEAVTGSMNPRAFAYGYDHVRMTAPVRVGETLDVTAEITATEEYDEEYGRVVYDTEATNGEGTVLVYEGITLVERRRAGD